MLDRIVHAFAVRNGVFAQVVREVAHVVGHHVHRRERHQVIPAVQRAYAHGAYRHAFHGAEHASDLHHVVLVHAVLKLDEDACDDVLYQLLRAEADGQAHHAGAGDQRPHVDADLRQQHHQRHRHDHDQRGIAEQRQQGALARAGHAPSFPLAQAVFDDAGDHGPGKRRDQQHDDDVQHDLDGRPAGVRSQPARQVECVPRIQDQQHHDDADDPADYFQDGRDVGVDARLQQRQAPPQVFRQLDRLGQHRVQQQDQQAAHADDQQRLRGW
ncbi:hypothetical protein G6F65_017521 [Rhizopus arrhizus]|nr:hypothetical protein G6F65_017521 [Rhizopus arrhizus]